MPPPQVPTKPPDAPATRAVMLETGRVGGSRRDRPHTCRRTRPSCPPSPRHPPRQGQRRSGGRWRWTSRARRRRTRSSRLQPAGGAPRQQRRRSREKGTNVWRILHPAGAVERRGPDPSPPAVDLGPDSPQHVAVAVPGLTNLLCVATGPPSLVRMGHHRGRRSLEPRLLALACALVVVPLVAGLLMVRSNAGRPRPWTGRR